MADIVSGGGEGDGIYTYSKVGYDIVVKMVVVVVVVVVMVVVMVSFVNFKEKNSKN